MSPKNYNKLTEFEEFVILNKGTERPWTGKFTDHKGKGVYVCRQCNAPPTVTFIFFLEMSV